ncbi:MAG: ABC-2 type transport system permease protein [Halieaceae bacterium]|jgi:ABC-2 type transport system permease protein
MKSSFFIAGHDIRNQLRRRSILLWIFLMPPIFCYFIGTMTGGFSSGISGGAATPITIVAKSPGFLQEQLELRLEDNNFQAQWVEALPDAVEADSPARTLSLDADLSDKVMAGLQVRASFDTQANALTRQFEELRIQRALYTFVADVIVSEAALGSLNAETLIELNDTTRVWQLDVAQAGQRKEIPSGFQQAVPGILVMFTLLVLLTGSGSHLVQERLHGLLRRLASAPISKAELLAGKWQARMVLAAIQIAVALLFGTFLFKMDWGPNLAMVIIVLFAWASFCASAGLWLGTVARTEAQANGLGVLTANGLAALGGCWWPIEVTPDWMQFVQKLVPTGWTMNALHRLISFQGEAVSVLPNVAVLLLAAAVFGWLATRSFKYS